MAIDNFMNALAGFGAGVGGKGQEFLQQQNLAKLGQQLQSGQIDQTQYLQQLALTDPMAARQVAGVNTPMVSQLAQQYIDAQKRGDTQMVSALERFGKIYDKGVETGPQGVVSPIQGYGPSVAGIAGAKAGAEQQAKKDVDLTMNPQIEGASTAATESAKNKATADATKEKKAVAAEGMLGLVGEARDLLPKASSGLIGSIGAGLKGAVSYSDDATQADKQLKVISAALVSNVPRMEGPQSDKDVAMYREAAGDIGNISIPYPDRLAALDQIEKLQEKYAGQGTSKSANSANAVSQVKYNAAGDKAELINGQWVVTKAKK